TSPIETRRSALGACAPAVSSLAVGFDQSCAIVGTSLPGEVWCWEGGQPLVAAQLANGQTGLQVSIGDRHTCVRIAGGQVVCWGANDAGQIDTTSSAGSFPNPVPPVNGGAPFFGLDLAADLESTCVTHNDGFLTCWGGGISGLHFGSLTNVRVTNGGGLPRSGPPSCAILSDLTVRCWGANEEGELGNGTSTEATPSTPATPTGVANVSSITTGGHRPCALDINGTVKCWGGNLQNADGRNFGPTPVTVDSAGDVLAVSSGLEMTCLLRTNGSVQCFEGTSTPRATVALSGPARALALAGTQGCAALEAGGVECWNWGFTNFPGSQPRAILFCDEAPVISEVPTVITVPATGASGALVTYPLPNATHPNS